MFFPAPGREICGFGGFCCLGPTPSQHSGASAASPASPPGREMRIWRSRGIVGISLSPGRPRCSLLHQLPRSPGRLLTGPRALRSRRARWKSITRRRRSLRQPPRSAGHGRTRAAERSPRPADPGAAALLPPLPPGPAATPGLGFLPRVRPASLRGDVRQLHCFPAPLLFFSPIAPSWKGRGGRRER